jgi:hypothetical protein
MAQAAVQTLVDRWLNDPSFRGALRADPEAAVRATGLDLDADEWAALRAIDWKTSDSELEARLSPGTC